MDQQKEEKWGKKEKEWMQTIQRCYTRGYGKQAPLSPMLLMVDQLGSPDNLANSKFETPYHKPTAEDFTALRWISDTPTQTAQVFRALLVDICDFQSHSIAKGKSSSDPLNLCLEEMKDWICQFVGLSSVDEQLMRAKSRRHYINQLIQQKLGTSQLLTLLSRIDHAIQSHELRAQWQLAQDTLTTNLNGMIANTTVLIRDLVLFLYFVFRSTPQTTSQLGEGITMLRYPNTRQLRRVMQSMSGQCLSYLIHGRFMCDLFPSDSKDSTNKDKDSALYNVNSSSNAFLKPGNTASGSPNVQMPPIFALKYADGAFFGSKTQTKWFETGLVTSFQKDSNLMTHFLHLHGIVHELARLSCTMKNVLLVAKTRPQLLLSRDSRGSLKHLLTILERHGELAMECLSGMSKGCVVFQSDASFLQGDPDSERETADWAPNYNCARFLAEKINTKFGLCLQLWRTVGLNVDFFVNTTERMASDKGDKVDKTVESFNRALLNSLGDGSPTTGTPLERLTEELQSANSYLPENKALTLGTGPNPSQPEVTPRVNHGFSFFRSRGSPGDSPGGGSPLSSEPTTPRRMSAELPSDPTAGTALHKSSSSVDAINPNASPALEGRNLTFEEQRDLELMGGGKTNVNGEVLTRKQAKRYQILAEHNLWQGHAEEATRYFVLAIELEPSNPAYRAGVLEAAKMRLETQKLWMPKSKITDDDICEHLAREVAERPLQEIQLGSNLITARGAAALCNSLLRNSAFLTKLSLYKNEIGDDGLMALCGVLGTRGSVLRKLDINENRITEKGGKLVGAMLQTNTSLAFLDIGFNELGDNGVVAITQGVLNNPNTSMEDLRLSDTGFTDTGATSIITLLENNQTLTNISVTRKPVLRDPNLRVRLAKAIKIPRKHHAAGLGVGSNPDSPRASSITHVNASRKQDPRELERHAEELRVIQEAFVRQGQGLPAILALGGYTSSPADQQQASDTMVPFHWLSKIKKVGHPWLFAKAEQMIFEITAFQSARATAAQATGVSAHTSPIHLMCEEFKQWLVDMAGFQLSSKEDYRSITLRVKYVQDILHARVKQPLEPSTRGLLNRLEFALSGVVTHFERTLETDKMTQLLSTIKTDSQHAIYNCVHLLFYALRGDESLSCVESEGVEIWRKKPAALLEGPLRTASGLCVDFLVNNPVWLQLFPSDTLINPLWDMEENPFLRLGTAVVPGVIAKVSKLLEIEYPDQGKPTNDNSGVIPAFGRNRVLMQRFVHLHGMLFEMARVIVCLDRTKSVLATRGFDTSPWLNVFLDVFRVVKDAVQDDVSGLLNEIDKVRRAEPEDIPAEYSANYMRTQLLARSLKKLFQNCARASQGIETLLKTSEKNAPDGSAMVTLEAVEVMGGHVSKHLGCEKFIIDHASIAKAQSLKQEPSAAPAVALSGRGLTWQEKQILERRRPGKTKNDPEEDVLLQASQYHADGWECVRCGDPEGAVRQFTLALELDPTNAQYATDIAQAARERTRVQKICRPKARLTDENVGVEVAELARNASVQLIDLSSNSLGPAGAKVLCDALLTTKSLTSLTLYHNQIQSDGAKALAGVVQNHPTLQRLDLNDNKIDGLGAIALAEALKNNTALTFLDLGYNPIGDDGVRAIADAFRENHLTAITDLRLASTGMGDQGAQALLAMLPFNSSLVKVSHGENPKIGEAIDQKLSRRTRRRWKEFSSLAKEEREQLNTVKERILAKDPLTYPNSCVQFIAKYIAIPESSAKEAARMRFWVYVHLCLFTCIVQRLRADLHEDSKLEQIYDATGRLALLVLARAVLGKRNRASGNPQSRFFDLELEDQLHDWMTVLALLAVDVKDRVRENLLFAVCLSVDDPPLMHTTATIFQHEIDLSNRAPETSEDEILRLIETLDPAYAATKSIQLATFPTKVPLFDSLSFATRKLLNILPVPGLTVKQTGEPLKKFLYDALEASIADQVKDLRVDEIASPQPPTTTVAPKKEDDDDDLSIGGLKMMTEDDDPKAKKDKVKKRDIVEVLEEMRGFVAEIGIACQHVAPCFSEDLQIAPFFCKRYHQHLVHALNSLMHPVDQLAVHEVLHIVQWLQWYEARGRLLNSGKVGRDISTELNQYISTLMEKFLSSSRERLTTWAGNILRNELSATPDLSSAGHYSSPGPQDLFSSIDNVVTLVVDQFHLRDAALVSVAKLLADVLREFHAKAVEAFNARTLRQGQQQLQPPQQPRETIARSKSELSSRNQKPSEDLASPQNASRAQLVPQQVLSEPLLLAQINNCDRYQQETENLMEALCRAARAPAGLSTGGATAAHGHKGGNGSEDDEADEDEPVKKSSANDQKNNENKEKGDGGEGEGGEGSEPTTVKKHLERTSSHKKREAERRKQKEAEEDDAEAAARAEAQVTAIEEAFHDVDFLDLGTTCIAILTSRIMEDLNPYFLRLFQDFTNGGKYYRQDVLPEGGENGNSSTNNNNNTHHKHSTGDVSIGDNVQLQGNSSTHPCEEAVEEAESRVSEMVQRIERAPFRGKLVGSTLASFVVMYVRRFILLNLVVDPAKIEDEGSVAGGGGGGKSAGGRVLALVKQDAEYIVQNFKRFSQIFPEQLIREKAEGVTLLSDILMADDEFISVHFNKMAERYSVITSQWRPGLNALSVLAALLKMRPDINSSRREDILKVFQQHLQQHTQSDKSTKDDSKCVIS